MSCISLTTDFGAQDWFVGAMKGVILRLAPTARIVDLCHHVPAGDIRAGAFVLAAGSRFFPPGTVHVAVVDPGVGGARAGLAVETETGFFVGPDNGLLSWALAGQKLRAARRLDNERYWLRPLSRTFHGRDVFAPVAAHLARGVPLSRLGPAVQEWVKLDWPQARVEKARVEGEVVYVDRFGNAITNIPHRLVAPPFEPWAVWCGGRSRCGLAPCYEAVRPGQAVAVPGSSGFWEIAVNMGHAARQLGLQVGTKVSIRRRASRASRSKPAAPLGHGRLGPKS